MKAMKKIVLGLAVPVAAVFIFVAVAYAIYVGYLSKDSVTNGANWQIAGYGDCAYILAAYDVENPRIEYPIEGGDSSGYDVVGGPLIAEFQPYGVYNLVSTQGSGDPRALWYPSGHPKEGYARAACYFNDDSSGSGAVPNTYSITLDGVPEGDYRLAVYVVDWDNGSRIEIVAATSSGVTAPVTIDDFYNNGVYLIFKVHVGADEQIVLEVTQIQAPNAVVSGVFLDDLGEVVTGVELGDPDWVTQGAWVGNYGNAWYLLNAMNVPTTRQVYSWDPSYDLTGGLLSAGITYSVDFSEGRYGLYAWTGDLLVSGNVFVDDAFAYAWGQAVDDRALLTTDPGTWTTRPTCWDSEWSYAYLMVTIPIPDMSMQMAIYAVDYDCNNRDQTYYIYDNATFVPTDFDPASPGAYLATATTGPICDYGVYDIFEVTGPGEIAIVVVPTNSNAVISGIFFDDCVPNVLPPAEPRTIGFWKHQVSGKGKAHISEEDMWGYLEWIKGEVAVFDDVIALFEGDDPSVWGVLNAKKMATMKDRAKQQFMALLLNIASDKLSYYHTVDFTGTEAEGLTELTVLGDIVDFIEAVLLSSESTREDYEVAKTIADVINNGVATD